jgi:hypothetical protein
MPLPDLPLRRHCVAPTYERPANNRDKVQAAPRFAHFADGAIPQEQDVAAAPFSERGSESTAHLVWREWSAPSLGPRPVCLAIASVSKLCGNARVLGCAQVTGSQFDATTEVDLTGMSMTVTVPAEHRIRITGQGHFRWTAADNI